MVRKLDRYLFVSFLYPTLLCLTLILAMVIVVETSENLSKMLRYSGGEPFSKLLGQYYLCRIPILATMIAPIITLSGAIFALVRLARSNELMAMQAVGISMKRIGLPLLSAGMVAALTAAYAQEIIVPESATTMQRVKVNLIGSGKENPSIYRSIFAVDPKTSLWLSIAEIDTSKKIMRNAVAGTPSEGISVSPRQIDEGRWRNGRWYVRGSRTIETEEGLQRVSFKDEILETQLSPEELAEGAVDIEQRSLKELQTFAELFPSRRHKLKTEINKRLAYPLSNIVLLLLAIPLVIGPGGQTSVKGIGYAVLGALAFYVVMMVMLDFGYRGYVPPYIAAWGPMLLFTLVGVWMYRRMHA